MLRTAFLTLVTALLPLFASAQLSVEQIAVRIPVAVPEAAGQAAHTAELAGNIYRPQGTGPWGLVVLSHGTPGDKEKREAMTDRYGPQARAIAQLGYVVVTALRRGYGASDGPQADRYGSCDAPNYWQAAQEASRDLAAVTTYAQTLPYVDSANVVLIGKSAGGFASLALAAQQPAGVRGVISFAGGRGSQPQMRKQQQVCGEAALLDTMARFARTTRVPMLWVYAQNDSYFRRPLVEKMAAAYQYNSPPGLQLSLQFVDIAHERNLEGHGYFDRSDNIRFWLPEVRKFLRQQAPGTAAAQAMGHDTKGDKP